MCKRVAVVWLSCMTGVPVLGAFNTFQAPSSEEARPGFVQPRSISRFNLEDHPIDESPQDDVQLRSISRFNLEGHSMDEFKKFDAPLRGISYGPVPSKTVGDMPANDDFMSEAYRPLWGDDGRGDLRIMSKLGANAVRLYGNDPRFEHSEFLDAAHLHGLEVIPGMSNYPFVDAPDACSSSGWDCYSQLKAQFKHNLQKGFASNGAYHPALKRLIIINEPDYKAPGLDHPDQFTKAIISAFDGMLDAEKEMGITENLIKFTATFSFGVCAQCTNYSSVPAMGQMYNLRAALENPASVGYLPRNDLKQAFLTRWVNSFNTASPAFVIENEFLIAYKAEFKETDFFIGEYHAYMVDQHKDMKAVMKLTEDPANRFLGISYFEFQQAYWKGGTELQFGLLAFGESALNTFNAFGQDYTTWCLKTIRDPKSSLTLDASLAEVYGGEGYDFVESCRIDPSRVPLTAFGFKQVIALKSDDMMAVFVSRVIGSLGGKAHDVDSVKAFAQKYSGVGGTLLGDDWDVLVADIWAQPSLVVWHDSAACVADRKSPVNLVADAIKHECSLVGSFDCTQVPIECMGDVYLHADYIFSVRFLEPAHSQEPPRKCDRNIAAKFVPSQIYTSNTSRCVVSKDPSITALSQEGYEQVATSNSSEKLAVFARRVLTAGTESVSDDFGFQRSMETLAAQPPATFRDLKERLHTSAWVCGGSYHRPCGEANEVVIQWPLAALPVVAVSAVVFLLAFFAVLVTRRHKKRGVRSLSQQNLMHFAGEEELGV